MTSLSAPILCSSRSCSAGLLLDHGLAGPAEGPPLIRAGAGHLVVYQ